MQVLPNRDVGYLDKVLLDGQGRLQVVPAELYARIDPVDLRIFCHHKAFYGLPTTELVDYLRDWIGGRRAIEIGAGNGVLGRALGITMVDNYCQEIPKVRLLYTLSGQPTVTYGSDVRRMDALKAVKHFRPEVVVASWVTQSWKGGDVGCMYGVDEEKLLKRVEGYAVFGSMKSHGKDAKRISNRPHQVIQEPWMYSRSPESALFIWD